MLVALGFLMVAVFMFLIMSKRATPGSWLYCSPGCVRSCWPARG